MAWASKVGDVVVTRNGVPFTVSKLDGENMEVIKADGSTWSGRVTDMKLDEGQGDRDAVGKSSGRRSRNAQGVTLGNRGSHWLNR